MVRSVRQEGIELPDRQLACTRLNTNLARDYFAGMASAVKFCLCQPTNPHALGTWRLEEALGLSPCELKFRLLYDVCHNIAKIESHTVNGEKKKLCVHRKGATRAFPASHPGPPPSSVPLDSPS